ncbi:TonB-dependent receptor [uncultured Culturomica sp.]|uniref:SusC/RagA family TonB-linked outer membrane protein n=1 Tax=uncultured Culturomica sp. TaxID=1926654 RepID=UPI00259A2462|nr:TonB-dependent receptor [uncultured Culturomica sp.]
MMKQKLFFWVISLFIGISALQAQDISVSGVVKSKGDGQPLPGVAIMVKGATTGVTTDIDGNYAIKASAQSILVFRFIGYAPQEIKVAGRTRIDVTMEEEAQLLEDVVVVGYGTMKKSDLTGSVASVKAAEVTKTSSGSVEKLLQGRVAGLQIINNSEDNPQGGATVRIRGASSINGSNAPLVVVDGVPMGDAGNLNSINPNIISSIEVLKDASATAIYGSRGANGVIMITTKNGKGDKANVWFSGKVGASIFSKKLDYWRNPLQMAMLENEAYENAGLEALYVGKKDVNGAYYPSIAEIRDGEWPYYTDWSDYIFRTAITQDYNMGVEGSTERSRYYISLGYYSAEGMQIGDDYDKLSFDMSYDNDVTNNLSIKTKAGIFKGKRNYNYGMDYSRNPLFPVYNGDGSYFKAFDKDYGNPVMMTEQRKNVADNVDAYASLKIDWDILSGLNFAVQGNVRAGTSNTSFYNPPKYTDAGDRFDGEGGMTNGNYLNYIVDAYLTYNKLFGKDHSFSAMGGVSYEDNVNKGSSITGRGFQNHVLQDENLAGAENRYVGNYRSETELASAFTRINYTYKNRYMFTFTGRVDGSSKFGENNKWGFFPSGAVSWRLSEEEFIKNLGIFDNLKLRASYGISGNQGISPYQTFEQFGSNYYYVDGKEYIIYGVGKEVGREGIGDRYVLWGGMPNDELGWEKTSQVDIGVDFSLFNNRLDVTFDYYRKVTTDLLREKLLTPSSAYDKVWVNDGEIQNKGFEFAINGRIITQGAFRLNAGLIFSANKNKVVNIGTKEDSGYIEDVNGVRYQPYGGSVFNDAYLNILAIGQPINVFYGYKVDGIIQNMPANPTKMTRPGEFNYAGLREDGSLDPDARRIIGDPNPKFTSSLNIQLTHKSGLDLSVMFYGVYGNDIFSPRKLDAPSLRAGRWTPETPNNNRPSLRADRSYFASSWFVEDGSFLRIQNITLGYTLPEHYLKCIKNLRVYLNVSNPVTFSNVSEYDPEVGENGRGPVAFPRTCTFTTGLELKF